MMEKPWIVRALYQIWPAIYRFINRTIFVILMIIRSGVREAINQIKKI